MFGRRKNHRSQQQRRVQNALNERQQHSSTMDWFRAVVDALGDDDVLEDDTLQSLTIQLHEATGAYDTSIANDHDAHRWLWSTLADRYADQPRLKLLAADAELNHQGDAQKALADFFAVARSAPQLFQESAGEFWDAAKSAGPEAWLRYRLLQILSYSTTIESEEDVDALTELVEEVLDELGETFAS